MYDSWGKLISTTGTLEDTVGAKNPYRYRGYRYDTETGYYYLQSRYYNPNWGRFINADGYIGRTSELLSHNLFAYSVNNPVNMKDSSGYSYAPAINLGWSSTSVGAILWSAIKGLGGTIIKGSGGVLGALGVLGGMILFPTKTATGELTPAQIEINKKAI